MSIKHGSKYYPLFEHLQSCQQEETTLTFAEIEALIGRSLPTSAYTKKNWWSNRDTTGALQAGAWVTAGFHVDTIDLEQKIITLRKFKAEYDIQQKDGEIVWRRDAIRALRKHMGLTQADFAEEMGVRRQTVSEWENGVYDPDRSTARFLRHIAKQADFQVPENSVDTE